MKFICSICHRCVFFLLSFCVCMVDHFMLLFDFFFVIRCFISFCFLILIQLNLGLWFGSQWAMWPCTIFFISLSLFLFPSLLFFAQLARTFFFLWLSVRDRIGSEHWYHGMLAKRKEENNEPKKNSPYIITQKYRQRNINIHSSQYQFIVLLASLTNLYALIEVTARVYLLSSTLRLWILFSLHFDNNAVLVSRWRSSLASSSLRAVRMINAIFSYESWKLLFTQCNDSKLWFGISIFRISIQFSSIWKEVNAMTE